MGVALQGTPASAQATAKTALPGIRGVAEVLVDLRTGPPLMVMRWLGSWRSG